MSAGNEGYNDSEIIANEDQSSTAKGAPQRERESFIDLPTRYDRWEPLAEVLATVILALATLATAWSGYQSARWGGVQSAKYSQAGALRTESTRASNQAGQLVQVDIGLFTNWINAYAMGDQQLTDFYQQRFRAEFKPAFEAWVATKPAQNPDAPASPFAMPEYQVSLITESERLVQEAEKTFEEGQAANEISDAYVRNTVILASVLFLAGISSRFKSFPLRLAIILLGLALLAFGLFNLLTYPIE